MSRLKIKICGIRSLENATDALDAGADFLGFNFVPSSKRYISPQVAKGVIEELNGRGVVVGVFQNENIHQVNATATLLGLDFVQLHGDETNEYCQKVHVPVIKTISLQNSLQKTEFLLNTYKGVSLFLVDRPIQGKGPIVDLKKVKHFAKKYPIILAGGLNKDNITNIFSEVGKGTYGFDINSGVENKDGKKDKDLIRNFVEKIRAMEMDMEDPLQKYKSEFYLTGDKIYMDGNSLGLYSKRAEKAFYEISNAYKLLGIDTWTQGENPLFYLPEKLGAMCAPLLGAHGKEVIIAGSTTVNIHQLLTTFFKPEGKRKKILTDEFAFPTDMYAIKSQLLLHGLDLVEDLILIKSKDKVSISEEDIIANMHGEVALILLPVVFYKSGQMLNVRKIVHEAHKRNILIGFDACHSAGIVPHNFHKDGVDFAVFCTYKYLNGGPGSPAGIFVHEKHFGEMPGLIGWFGSDKSKQFDMTPDFQPAYGVGAYQMGTPHVFSMAPLLGSLTMFHEISIEIMRKHSLKRTKYMMDCIERHLGGFGFSIITPRDEKRGGHVAVAHKEAASICKALKKCGVIPDFRPPNIVRLAPVPLYTSFLDILQTVEILKTIMVKKEYEKFHNIREVVA